MLAINGRLLHIVVGTVAVIALVFAAIKRIKDNDLTRCRSLLSRGRWSHSTSSNSSHLEWHPASCMKPHYKDDTAIIENCFKDIVLIGDSTARQLYTELSAKYVNASEEARAHASLSLPVPTGKLDFIWDPFLNSTSLFALREFKTLTHASVEQRYSPTFAVIGGGLHHARYLDTFHNQSSFRDTFSSNVRQLLDSHQGLRDTEVIPVFLPVQAPMYKWLDPDRQTTITKTKIDSLQNELSHLATDHSFEILDASREATLTSDAFLDDGLHQKSFVPRMQLEVLTARLCPRAYDHSCCSKQIEIAHGQVIALALAIVFVSFFLFASARQSGSSPLQQACAVIAITLIYCFVADRTMLFERITKLVDGSLFISLSLFAFMIGGLFTARRTAQHSTSWTAGILSRQQTEEWKGWMQVVVLLYHYFGMSHTLWVYRMIRLLVASYIFLTGYGHASYFLYTKDFSLRRVMTVLLRINFLACLLPFVMNTTYQFYYFPMLASMWFMITWATIPNETITWFSLLRIVYSAVLVGFVYKHRATDNFFGLLLHSGMVSLEFKEFQFRVGLDLYAAFCGMALAMLQHLLPDSMYHFRYLRLGLWLGAAAMFIIYFAASAGQTKTTYNRHHNALSILPILGFIIVRNATPTWRNHYSRFFAWIGRHSLETFVLQYHIWLAADTKGLLHLGLIDALWTEPSTKGSWRYWVEMFIITGIFFWTCAAVSKASAVIVAAIVGIPDPSDTKEALAMYYTEHEQVSQPAWNRMSWQRLSYEMRLRIKAGTILLGLWVANCWYLA